MPAATALVHGTWTRGDGTLRAGRVTVYSNAQVSFPGDGVLLPQGLVYTGPLNEDEASNSGRSFALPVPLADQPGVIPQNFTLTIVVKPQGAEPATFRVSPRAATVGDDIDLSMYVPETDDVNPLQGEPGQQGVKGDKGEPGAEGVLPPFLFPTPIATWTIEHNLGRLPVVALYDASGHLQWVDPEVTESHVVVTWPFPVAGKAILR
jgi:hypothetical protein